MPTEQHQQEKSSTLAVLCAYAKVDTSFQQALAEHLCQLDLDGLTLEWYQRPVTPEIDWTSAFDPRVNTASIILVLLSSDLFLSDYCSSREMQRACERHALQEALVIPLLLSPIEWQKDPFAQFQIPFLRVPIVTRWSPQGEDFSQLVHHLHAAIQDVQKAALSRAPHPLFPIWYVPSPRNDLFTGREEVLARISTLFAADQAGTSTISALYGPSGIGKTEIAREYAYRCRHHYLSVFWVRADTHEALVSGFVSIAERLDLPEHNAQDKMLAVKAVKHWLGRASWWLLILDDVSGLPSVKTFLPETWSGHILLTTQALIAEELVCCIRVEPMTPKEGGTFLLQQRALCIYEPSESEASEEDRDLAEEIAREAKGFPLALDHAGAYLLAAACSIKGYLSLYRRESIWQRKQRGNDFADHLHPVANTFVNAFEDIEKWYPAGADMLRVCAFLHPHAIPEELIFRGATCLGPHIQALAKDSTKLREALNALCEYALLNRNATDQTLSIHRLVQGILKEEMDADTYRDWATRVIQALSKTFPKRGAATWIKCQRWLPHALACGELIEYLEITVPEATQLLHRAGNYASECGLYIEADVLLRQALSISEKMLGVHHSDTIEISNSFADLLEKRTDGM
jgi:hypothetical protein